MYIAAMANHNHGDRQRYVDGCRCRRCRKAWREYIAGRRRAQGRPDRDAARVQQDVRRTAAIVERAVEAGADVEMPVELTPLGGQILVANQQRTGRSRGAVLDDLLREHGTDQEAP